MSERYTSQNVIVVCDFDMVFTFAVAGWPGSAHGSLFLNHALQPVCMLTSLLFVGNYYISDSGYPKPN